MKIQTLIVLVVATGAVGGAALYLAKQNRAEVKSEVAAGRLFPNLSDKVNTVSLLTIKKGDKEYSVKKNADGGWESPDKGGYPVKVEKVKEILVGLAELRTVEPKTSKPENYSKIGVEDPGTAKPEKPATPDAPAPTSNAALLTLKDDKGGTVAEVIIGNTKYDGSKPGVYIRKAGDAQSWLTEGKVELPYDFTGWVEPQIVNIPRERIKSGTITHPDGEVTRVFREKKEDQNFTVANVPQGEELMSPNAGDAIAAALAYISLSDVKPADQVDFAGTKADSGGKPGPSAEFQTFDGMKVLVQTWDTEVPSADGKSKETKTWAHFVAAYQEPPAPAPKVPEAAPDPKADETKAGDKKPEEVQKEVADFNAKCAKWAYEIPPYKASGFKTTVKTMLKSKPPAPPPTLNEGNTAAPLNPAPPPGTSPPTQVPPPAATGPRPPPAPANPPPAPTPGPTGAAPGSPVAPPKDPPAPLPGPTGPTGATGSTGATGG